MTMKFEAKVAEPWCEYLLEDGTTIRGKLILVRVTPRPGVYTPDGFQVYDMQWQQIVDGVPSERGIAEAAQRRGEMPLQALRGDEPGMRKDH